MAKGNKRGHKEHRMTPDGLIARVRLKIKPGGYNDPENGWTNDCATRNQTGAVYLNCQFEVIVGEHTGQTA